MTRSDPTAWTRLAFDSWALSVDAASVIWLRSLRIMAGGKLAEQEAERMVTEKVMANLLLWPFLLQGGPYQSAQELSSRTLRHYSGPVRANRRRLSR